MNNSNITPNYTIRTNGIWNILRATPSTYLVLTISYFLLKPSKLSLYLLISYLALNASNTTLKQIAEYIYSITVGKNNEMPIFGLGRRPDGAIDCGSFLNFSKKPPISYGMPSGHSQLTWAVVSYLLMCIYYNDNLNILEDFTENEELNNIYTILITIILLVFGVMVSYSRVVIENCHTVQQVIIGGIIGVIIGVLTHVFQKKVLNI